MANSNIPMLEAQKRADRDAVNGGQVVHTWAGQRAKWDLQQQQNRNQFTSMPIYSPPRLPSSEPAAPIGATSIMSSGTQTPASVDAPIEFCARAGAFIMVMLALITEGGSIGTLISWGLIGAAGGALLGLAIAAAIIIFAWLLKLLFWGALLLFVLQLLA